jgi:hypothetical protein
MSLHVVTWFVLWLVSSVTEKKSSQLSAMQLNETALVLGRFVGDSVYYGVYYFDLIKLTNILLHNV